MAVIRRSLATPTVLASGLLVAGALLIALGGCEREPSDPGPEVCHTLQLAVPVSRAPLPPPARDVHLASLSSEPSDYFVSFVTTDVLDAAPLMSARMLDPFVTWPPAIQDSTERFSAALFHIQTGGARTPTGSQPPLLVDGRVLLRPGRPTESLFQQGDPSLASFVSTIGPTTLIGSARREPSTDFFRYGLTLLEGNARLVLATTPACVEWTPQLAGTPLVDVGSADVPGPRYLVAMAINGDETGACSTTPPRFIALDRYARASASSPWLDRTRSARVEADGPVTFVRVTSSDAGAWLSFASTTEGGLQVLKVAPLDADGVPSVAPQTLGSPVVTGSLFEGGPPRPLIFALAVAGDDLAVAWPDDAGSVHVRLVHRDGTLGAHAIAATALDPATFGDIQIVADAKRRGVVVSWEMPVDDVGFVRSSAMARFDCLSTD